MIFKHVVRKSTLREGIAVPKDFEEWFQSPEAGSKREITLVYEKQEINVTLRRLNNRKKHVQIKYETKKQAQFREWLWEVFKASRDITIGEIIEFHKISRDRYLLKPVTVEEVNNSGLRISRTLHHGGADKLVSYIPAFKEVSEIISSIKFVIGNSQAFYNQKIKEGFLSRAWESDKPVAKELGLKCDFRKENVQIEVEFGNARAYYQDYLKFSISFNEGLISLGGLIVPTFDFANVLCEIGKQKALGKARQLGIERTPTYSGMITFEKADQEFQHLKFMLNMPIVVMGIDYK